MSDHITLAAAATSFAAGDGFVNPAKLSAEERSALLKAIDEDEVVELRFRARVYADEPNPNFSRLDPDYLETAVANANARSSAQVDGPSLATDHWRWSVSGRVGRIDRMAIEAGNGAREVIIEATLLRKQAMEEFARGLLDRFSVGLNRITARRCSLCGEQWREGYWGMEPGCKHEPGVDGCEVFLTAEFNEVSFVFSPAVSGTHVFSAQPKENQMTVKQDADVVAELAAKEAAFAAREAELTAKITSTEAALASERGRLRDLDLEAAIRDGRILPAELSAYREIWDTLGEKKCKEMLSMRAPHAAPAAAFGAPVSEPVEQGKPVDKKSYARSMVDKAASFGLCRRPTDAELANLSYLAD
jgi:hypothetical protein